MSDRQTPHSKPDLCPVCSKSMYGLRPTAKYCSAICKQRAYVERNGIVTTKPPQELVCNSRKCDNPIVGKKSNAKFCCSNCRKMESYWKKEAMLNELIRLLK